MSYDDNDCMLVRPDGRVEPVPEAIWSEEKNGWYFDPPIVMKPGTTLTRRSGAVVAVFLSQQRRPDS